MTLWHDLGLIAPVWVLGLAAACVLLLSVAGGVSRPATPASRHLAFVALAGLGAAGWLLLGERAQGVAFSGAIRVDGLSLTFGGVALLAAALGVLLAQAYTHEHQLASGELIALMLLSTCGGLLLTMAGDLMTLFIGVELMSLGVYVLAGYRRGSRRSQEAALKYFVYGAFASAFVLFGIALLYGEVGGVLGTPSLGFGALARAFAADRASVLGLCGVALVLCGLGFKVAAVPFHMWAPDVYEGSPTVSTAFMAVAVKVGAFAGLCRVVAATLIPMVSDARTGWVWLLEILAVLTMVVGNLLAIRQSEIKRMLAYSSIAHAGYLLVGVVAWTLQPHGRALEAMAYYLLGYAAMTLGAFGVVLAFEKRGDRGAAVAIERLAGAAHRYPAIGLAMAVFMFALAGVPPSAGFFGKLSVFVAAVEAGRVGLVVVAALASAVGAFYYLRVLVIMYMREPGTEHEAVRSAWLTSGLWACAAVTVVVGVAPNGTLAFARASLAALLAGS